MTTIKSNVIKNKIKLALIEMNYEASINLQNLYKKGLASESSELSKKVFSDYLDNIKIAREELIPMCQDTGSVVLFIDIGEDVFIEGDSLVNIINSSVKEAYTDGFLRMSMVSDPLRRINSGNNLPCVMHINFVPGNELILLIGAKGGGSENMSRIKMLAPGDGLEGVKKFIIETVTLAGPNPCPPITVGVGIGSNFEGVAELSKRALFRDPDKYNEDVFYASIEKELENTLNNLGIGPGGLKGNTTTFGVNILVKGCHIASLPVAVNINCHMIRHKKIVLGGNS